MQNPWLNFSFIVTGESSVSTREALADEIAIEINRFVEELVMRCHCSDHGVRTLKMGRTVTCFDVAGRIIPIVYCCDRYGERMRDHWDRTRSYLQAKYAVDLIHPDEL